MPGIPPPPHPITSAASLWRLYWLIITRPRFGRRYLRLISTIIRTYFLPQFEARKRERVMLDLDLDYAIPFDPSWMRCYLGFVRMWQGTLGWMHRRFGDAALPEMFAFMEGMETLFLEARRVFARRDSTLGSRPGPLPVFESMVLHLADRNSFCFPSLHVMIVRFNAMRLAQAVSRLGGPGEDYSGELAFLEGRASRITESILHVKQHSISDVPAGLFLLYHLGGLGGVPAGDKEADLRFLAGLFPDDAHGPRSREFMGALYARLHAAAKPGAGAHDVLVDFLESYEEEIGKLTGKP